jgi:hypothetical protein
MMNHKVMSLSLVLALFGAGAAQGMSKDEGKLEKASLELEKDSSKPENEKRIGASLKSEFKLEDSQVAGLRAQKLGYGEISTVLALAETMPGGATDANIQTLVAKRQGPPVMGWGQIAKELDVKLGKVIGKVKKVDASARKLEKAEAKRVRKEEKAAAKAARAEKHERPARVEKTKNH